MEDDLVGQYVAGRFEVLQRIGEGGMGFVYKARQEPIGRLVALKILLPEVTEDERTVSRFLNEARIISQLRHHNTVKLIDFGTLADGRLFIAMEYLDGGTLHDLMSGQRLGQLAALRIAQQICKSLAEAHALGIIHRDLKPENVLLDEMHGESTHVRVVDFGLAKVPQQGVPTRHMELKPFGRTIETSPGVRLGTPAYMSPEQAFARPVDGRSDLYGVGVLLYRMLTGHVPFDGDNTTGLVLAHLHDAPRPMAEMAVGQVFDPGVESLVTRLLSKDPDGRPESADLVIRELNGLIERLTPSEGSVSGLFTIVAAPRPAEITPPSEELRFAPTYRRRGVFLAFLVGAAAAVVITIALMK